MAYTDDTLTFTGTTPQTVLIGTSIAFQIQNTSRKSLRHRIQGSTAKGGIMTPLETVEFNYNIEIWVDRAEEDEETIAYIIRG